MEQFLDAIFGVRWWQWLLGTGCVAGLYYVVWGIVVPHFHRLHALRVEEAMQQEQEEAEAEKQRQREAYEAERRAYVKKIPSGPVEPVDLPKAALHVRKRIVAVPSNAETTFGTRRGVGVQLMVRGVSREHAKIRPEADGYVLYDLMSQSGTFVGDERVERKVLADGEVFRVGPVEILFRLGDARREE